MRTEDEIRASAVQLVSLAKVERGRYIAAKLKKKNKEGLAEPFMTHLRILGMLRALSWVLGVTKDDLINYIRKEKTK